MIAEQYICARPTFRETWAKTAAQLVYAGRGVRIAERHEELGLLLSLRAGRAAERYPG